MKGSLNDLDAQIAALENESLGSAASEVSDNEGSHVSSSSDSDEFSGYSCDSSSSDESEFSDASASEDEMNEEQKRRADFKKKANQIARKKSRLGMSDICFKNLTGRCRVDDCIFRHCSLDSLNEEEKGDLVRELRRKPFDEKLGVLIKQLNIPVCKTFSKQGECKFQKCRFWHIETENDAKWAGSPFWCALCRKAFTSDAQLREHSNGKLHKSNAARA
jgi:hypothetical protein